MMNNIKSIKEAIAYVKEELSEDYSVWTSSGDGNWVQLYSLEDGISIDLTLTDNGNVTAKAYFSLPGFSGFVEGMLFTLPNRMLYRVVRQLETIKEFIPEGNINDLESVLILRDRKKQLKQRKLAEQN
ncbi:tail tape measure protein [Pectobacterium phage DU_PP_V]|uniref:Tail tape measure protein n=1 Tax=Pectobacterium phage DU_PP_V TaxID=2041492 RepID=A0A2D2W6U6_9CAUD|nr:tail tape measure protein [Pectobacterium phage DU_PP_V]ATS94019.1 tail tape measure protein [Pectobacterium phage DU_PP_V]